MVDHVVVRPANENASIVVFDRVEGYRVVVTKLDENGIHSIGDNVVCNDSAI
jgi:hypothetical protein